MQKIIGIIAQMTLEKKASLFSGKNFWQLKGIERLGIPSIMVTDGPHGLRKQARAADHVGLNESVSATCFPTASALAATWDCDLIYQVRQALGKVQEKKLSHY
jgi:beta-glucosidase